MLLDFQETEKRKSISKVRRRKSANGMLLISRISTVISKLLDRSDTKYNQRNKL